MDRLFDPTRKKYVAATPEEKVRQGFIKFLQQQGYPIEIIKTEVSLDFAGQKRRADIVIFRKQKPIMIIECKAPDVKINRSTFEQVWQYLYSMGAQYLALTNLKETYVCRVEEKDKCVFLEHFPTYEELKTDFSV